MTDKTHQLIGLTAATGVYLLQVPDTPITWPIATTVIIGSFFGSLAPDVDQPTSKFWDSIPLGGFFGKIATRALGGHRNLSHSILGTFLFSSLAYWISNQLPDAWHIDRTLFLSSFVIGFVAHLAADAVTVRGIPLFWPFGDDMGFPPYPFHGIRIITGKWFENLVVFPLTGLILIVIIASSLSRFCPIILGLCRR